MDKNTEPITLFKPYEFKIGQKITIQGSRRAGDWEVVDMAEHTITLKCPVTKKELTWNRFCYFVEEKMMNWPTH